MKYKINTHLEKEPAKALALLKKASLPRRIKMLLNILDCYADIGSRRDQMLHFKRELEAIKLANRLGREEDLISLTLKHLRGN